MTYRMISPKELYEKMKKGEKTYLLDVRAEEKFNEYHIEAEGFETRNLPKTIIFEGHDSVELIPKEEEIVVTCTTGNSASKCATILSEKDYTVLVLEGGITAWKEYLRTV